MATKPTASALKVFSVLDVLLRHFANGLSNTELAKATGLSESFITRAVVTLEEAGYAERIPGSERIRPSHRFAQHAVAIMRSLDAARARIDESQSRLTTHI
ncbi:helix-turn-helix domain-containing protein [Aquipseudomonas alcaligenes]|uniref:Helix-turn-helix domain-containing protein n=1 Tax=Aquipseudomonas alcaligenes TaxID=43263 RepID=A0AA42N338_AQUAC|nr:helix-turn-helix domain-containing protein [Pseudomonas alcaligenes]MDH1055624.1 helix-turn-helix domain-containing protein [Pseudomonas alcaligenes]